MHRNKNVQLFDIVVLLAIVMSIAFDDIKILFLASQILAFFFAILIAMKDNILKRKIRGEEIYT